jgi:hypothetical protein
MPIYKYDYHICEPMNIGDFIYAARRGVHFGPLPLMRTVEVQVNNLSTNEAALIPFGIKAQITRAYGLLTCACVIYVSNHPRAVVGAWVHHAPSGYVSIDHVNAALVALGTPPLESVLVIFATPCSYDERYAKSVKTIVKRGIPEVNTVVIPNLPVCSFGIDNQGFIG